MLVGRGISDITGEPAECGMLGYGKADQRTEGIHLRLRSRAFVIVDGATGHRVLVIVNDLPMVFTSIHQAVLARLHARFGDLYTEQNVMITATHTHCGPGGYSHHFLYNTTTGGFRPLTFGAIVDGITEAALRAHADVGPATVSLAHGELHDASVNRSRIAFERDPEAERAFFPDANDPQTTLLRIERDGRVVGAVNWFATHNTSMTNHNRLISSDNKGYAAYHWERELEGVDYRADDNPGFISAFAQTNAGDMSPNLDLRPGHGPTANEFANARILGTRQQAAAAALADEPGVEIDGGIDARLMYIDLANTVVGPEFTGDGRTHRTSGPTGGASTFAGAWADGIAFPFFREGRNPLFDAISERLVYRLAPRLADSQAPKGIVMPGERVNRTAWLVQDIAPVQLIRIGPLYLIGIPGEVTIVAGLRLRRAVAAIVGADLRDVLCAGYSNAYIHYVTTPEEYDAQQYEGGSTLFGRWELSAFIQAATAVARAMVAGEPAPAGPRPRDLSTRIKARHRPARPDTAAPGYALGDVLREPRSTYRAGDTASATFTGAYPNNKLRRCDTYLEVQRAGADGWRTIFDDGDWSTIFRWRRRGRHGSDLTVIWAIPLDAPAGDYRLRYRGDAIDATGAIREIAGTTRAFTVTR